MADSKITEMAEITSYDENVITPVVVSENGQFVNKMIRLKNIKGRDYVAGNGINIINDVISTNDSEINKQDPLVSGVNIKTINGMTLLGSGNITVEGGGTGGEVYVAGYGISITEGNAINVDTNELNNVYQAKMGSDDNYVTDSEKTKLANLSGINTGDQDLSGLLPKTDAALIYQVKMGSDDNYVTDSEKIKLLNLSGTNSGDETASTIKTKLGITTLSGSNTGDETTSTIKTKLGITTLSGVNTGDQDLTPYLTIVNASTTYQPLMGSDDNYVTDAEKTKLSNLSGINTGDQDLSGLLSKTDADLIYQPLMGIDDNYVTDDEKVKLNNLSGVNTGDQDLSNYLTLNGGTIAGNLSINGDLVVQGTGYETSLETLNVKNNYLKLRDGAITGMGVGEYVGIEAVLYDGVNNGRLVFDKDGIAKVGDSGNEQTLATREDSPISNGIAVWDSSTSKFITNTLSVSDVTNKQPLLVSGINIKTINNNSLLGSGNIELDLSNYLTKVEAGDTYQPLMGPDDNYMTDEEKTKLANLSGDQDLSGYLTKVEAGNTYQPLMGSDDNYVTDEEKTKLSNLSGVNTGDQDLSALSTYNYVDATFAPKTRTISAGAGLSGGGSLSSNITLSHADTSSASSITVTNTGTNVLQNLTVSLDTYGHVTNASSSSVDLGSIFALKSEAGGSASVWVPLEGITRLGSTTLSSTINYTNIIGEQTLVRWQESGTYKIAMVSSLSSSLIYIVGESMTTLDANTFEYCLLPVHEQKFVVAGSLNSVNTNITNIWIPNCSYRVFGCFAYVGTVGTTNNTTIDINYNGTSMFTTKPSIASGSQYTSTIATSDSGLIIGKNSIVTIDLDAVQTTPANDLYVSLYVCPNRYKYLP